ncbi:MAG: hypothetical protein LBM69_08760, partial [Lachnospiraceae bacterium]|nr:hypothetical protein [Lachnospiraceae bacterium]
MNDTVSLGIRREDILSLRFLEKSAYTGSYQGLRYRLEKNIIGEEKKLHITIWPEPFNYAKTAPESRTSAIFLFSEDGMKEAIDWMNR